MAGSDRLRAAAAVVALLVVAVTLVACAPRIPLERLHCPCADGQGYRCCEIEQICYPADEMPVGCAPAGAGGAGGAGGAHNPGTGTGGNAGAAGGDAGVDGGSDAGTGGSDAIDAGGGGTGGAAPPEDRAAVDGFFPLPPTILSTGLWLYTTTAPLGGWTQPGFDDRGWRTGRPGFFTGPPWFEDSQQTPWPEAASEIWVRTTFRVEAADVPRAVLWGRWDDVIEVFINGTLAARNENWTPGYRYLGFDPALLIPGAANTLAIRATNWGGPGYLDLTVALNEALTAPPMSGSERTPALAAYTTAVRRFMREHGIPGGVLAVMKRDQVVVNRAFGWTDKNLTRPLSPDAVMRLGAPEMLLTAGAVARLIDAGTDDPVTRERITRGTRVFPLLRAHGLTPLPGRTPAAEIDLLTVGMLLDFESGLGELPEEPAQLYADLGAAPGSPVTPADTVRWVYSVPLARTPGPPAGDWFAGHMVLRHLVQVVTGDLLGFMRSAVFGPAGSSDVFLAHEPLAARDAREPGYLTFEVPYERWIYLDASSAFATTAEAFVRFLRRYDARTGTLLLNPETQQWEARPDSGTFVYYGSMPGTWTLIVQRPHDQVSFAVFFNLDGMYDALLPELEAITNRLVASDWGL